MKEVKDCLKEYHEKLYSQPQVDNDQKMATTLTEDQNKALYKAFFSVLCCKKNNMETAADDVHILN